MHKKSLIFKFSVLLFLCSSSYALINVQLIPYLIRLGYSTPQRGLIVSFSAFASIFGQLLIGYISDKTNTVKKLFMNLTALLIVTIFLGYSISDHNFIFHFIVLGLGMMFFRICTNLAETWILGLDQTREKFGTIRGIGSAGWAIFSLISAYVIGYFGYSGIAILFSFLSLLILLVSFKLPDIETVETANISKNDFLTLISNKNYIILLIIFFIAFFVMNTDSFTVTDLIFEFGGNESDVGLRWFIQGFLELPAFTFGNILIHKLNKKRFLLMTLSFVFLRFFLYSLSTNITHIILISLLQMVTFPFLIIGQRIMIYDETPARLHATSQMIAVSVTMSASSILTPMFSGYLSLWLTNRQILLSFALISLIAIFILPLYKHHKEGAQL